MNTKDTYDHERCGANEEVSQDDPHDVFGNEAGHSIQYKTLSWQLVAVLMIAEIVSNGMLSLPSSAGAVGLVPNVIIIVFLGIFGTYTAWLLVQFKLNHPDVHNMGDAGYILFGIIGREVLSAGTVIFAVFATGGQLLAGQIALAALSVSKLCLMLYTGIFAIPTLICSFPRTLDRLSWLSVPSVICILIAGIVGMIGTGINPAVGRVVSYFPSSSFYEAFVSVTNPVFAYAGHFMFFILISEMRNPKDAMKAAYTLQIFATSFYSVFAIVTYYYIGDEVISPSFSSLPIKWQKAAYAIAIPNFLIAGSLYSHTASKLIFLRLFRKSKHLHSHTVIGWGVWTILIVVTNAAAFVLAVGVPIFNYLIGIAASLFASWFTYGLAGAFSLHDAYFGFGNEGKAIGWIGGGGSGWIRRDHAAAWKEGARAWTRHPIQTTLCVLTLLAGGFICVAGAYVTIKGIVDAYKSGSVGAPFSC